MAEQSSREVMERAIRRIGVLEHILLFLAAIAALAAGAIVSWLLRQAFGLPFRPTWMVSALLLFLLPAGVSYWKVRREERRRRSTSTGTDHE